MRTQNYENTGGVSLTQRQFFNQVFQLMGVGLAITAVVTYILAGNEGLMNSLFSSYQGVDSDGEPMTKYGISTWWWIAAALQLGMVFYLAGGTMMSKISAQTGMVIFGIYAALTGVTFAPVIYMYTEASVAKVFLITAITFTGCALWGYTTKRDLTGMGGFFLYALIGLIVAMLVNSIFQSPVMDYLVSSVAILIFAGLTAYDIQKLRQMHSQSREHSGLVVYGALSFYLDFINLFIHLLRIFGTRK